MNLLTYNDELTNLYSHWAMFQICMTSTAFSLLVTTYSPVWEHQNYCHFNVTYLYFKRDLSLAGKWSKLLCTISTAFSLLVTSHSPSVPIMRTSESFISSSWMSRIWTWNMLNNSTHAVSVRGSLTYPFEVTQFHDPSSIIFHSLDDKW
jgi:hypothetical protein